MAKGYSFESFAGHLGVSKQTLYTWTEKHPDFFDAKAIANEKCRLHWEKLAVGHVVNQYQGDTLNGRIWELNMRNRFPAEWGQSKQESPPEGSEKSLSDAERTLLLEYVNKSREFFGGEK